MHRCAQSPLHRALDASVSLLSEIDSLMVDVELLEAGVTVSPTRLYVGFEGLEAYLTASPSLSVVSTGSTVLFWSIEVNGEILEQNYDLEHARFTDEKGKRSDYFEITLNNNDGSISESFEIGDNVYLYFDENYPPASKVFHGLITGIDFQIDMYGHNKLVLSGEDYGSVRFGQTIISGAENYSNYTASDIVEDLIQRYCPEIATDNLEIFSEQIPYVSLAWEYVGQAIEKIANLIGADYYVDEEDDLHFYDPTDLTPAHSISPQQILNATIKRDSSKFFDRVFVVGGKQGFLDQSQAVTTPRSHSMISIMHRHLPHQKQTSCTLSHTSRRSETHLMPSGSLLSRTTPAPPGLLSALEQYSQRTPLLMAHGSSLIILTCSLTRQSSTGSFSRSLGQKQIHLRWPMTARPQTGTNILPMDWHGLTPLGRWPSRLTMGCR